MVFRDMKAVFGQWDYEHKPLKINKTFVYNYFAIIRTTSYTIILLSIAYRTTQSIKTHNVITWLVAIIGGEANSICGHILAVKFKSKYWVT